MMLAQEISVFAKQKSIFSSHIRNQWNEDKITLNLLTLVRGNIILLKIYCQIKFMQTIILIMCLNACV